MNHSKGRVLFLLIVLVWFIFVLICSLSSWLNSDFESNLTLRIALVLVTIFEVMFMFYIFKTKKRTGNKDFALAIFYFIFSFFCIYNCLYFKKIDFEYTSGSIVFLKVLQENGDWANLGQISKSGHGSFRLKNGKNTIRYSKFISSGSDESKEVKEIVVDVPLGISFYSSPPTILQNLDGYKFID